MAKDYGDKGSGNVEGIFKGLGELLDKLGQLAEKGEQLKRSGEFDFTSGGRPGKGVFGFTVKTGIRGGDEVSVEPFGNIKQDPKTGEAVVQEVSDPLVDILDEDDHILLLAEMPGVGKEDIKLELNGDVITIDAAKGVKKYYKEIVLPMAFGMDDMSHASRNGILEIKLRKQPHV